VPHKGDLLLEQFVSDIRVQRVQLLCHFGFGLVCLCIEMIQVLNEVLLLNDLLIEILCNHIQSRPIHIALARKL
jgi:hypothetical protein